MVSTRRRPARERGFTLIIVFLIIIVMVGIASAVMLSTQGDLQVSGHDRESATALYAAEAGVASAEWWMYRFPVLNTAKFLNSGAPGITVGAWHTLMSANGGGPKAMLCVNPAGAPVTSPPMGLPIAAAVPYTAGAGPPFPGTPVTYDGTRQAVFQWCVHNNALDPLYRLTPASPTCLLPDYCDGDNIITIESWGYGPNGASSHISVDVFYYNPITARCQGAGAQAGGSELKSGSGCSSDPPPSGGLLSRNL